MLLFPSFEDEVMHACAVDESYYWDVVYDNVSIKIASEESEGTNLDETRGIASEYAGIAKTKKNTFFNNKPPLKFE